MKMAIVNTDLKDPEEVLSTFGEMALMIAGSDYIRCSHDFAMYTGGWFYASMN